MKSDMETSRRSFVGVTIGAIFGKPILLPWLREEIDYTVDRHDSPSDVHPGVNRVWLDTSLRLNFRGSAYSESGGRYRFQLVVRDSGGSVVETCSTTKQVPETESTRVRISEKVGHGDYDSFTLVIEEVEQ